MCNVSSNLNKATFHKMLGIYAPPTSQLSLRDSFLHPVSPPHAFSNNIVTCVCNMWWALATFSPPRLGLTTSGGWIVKLPHPTRACLGGWVQKLLPPALLGGHFPLHSVAPFILLCCCPPVTAISLQMPSYCHRLPSSCCTPTSGVTPLYWSPALKLTI